MKKLFNELPLWGKVTVIALIVILVYVLFRKLMIYLQDIKKSQLSNTVANVTTMNSNGQPVTTQIDLGAKALEIYNAFYNYYGGMAEDEEAAINALKSVPNTSVSKLSQIYFSLYAKNLKEDFIKYTDFNEVSYKFI